MHYTIRDREFGTTFVFPTRDPMTKDLNPNPVTLDPESECIDCGKMIECGSNICEYCNKRYQEEARIEREIEDYDEY